MLSLPPVLATVRAALDQPVFPGKVVVWLLFMLSIIGWVMILSKLLQFRKIRLADERFTDRLRRSKTTLEVFEEGWEDDLSLKLLIYQAGARETAYQLLGTRETQDGLRQRIREAGKLVGRQIDFLRNAFQMGCLTAAERLRTGIEGLALVAAAAILLGIFGFTWTLMTAFDGAREFAELAPQVGGALGFLIISLIVAVPSILARLCLRAAAAHRESDLERFRDELARLFERRFASAVEPVRGQPVGSRLERDRFACPDTAPAEPETEPVMASPNATETRNESGGEKKTYHSIRDRLLRSEADEEESNPFRVNPIARQAAAAGKALRGY
jgi:biopolymer transport protein ExbB/TolQ